MPDKPRVIDVPVPGFGFIRFLREYNGVLWAVAEHLWASITPLEDTLWTARLFLPYTECSEIRQEVFTSEPDAVAWAAKALDF